MSENEMKEANRVFAKKLLYYLELNGMTQVDLAKRLGVSTASVNYWCKGIKSPRMDKIDSMCAIFNCRRSDFMEDIDESDVAKYYLNNETAQIAQEIHDNAELRALFSAAKDADPQTLKDVHDMLLIMKRREKGDQE